MVTVLPASSVIVACAFGAWAAAGGLSGRIAAARPTRKAPPRISRRGRVDGATEARTVDADTWTPVKRWSRSLDAASRRSGFTGDARGPFPGAVRRPGTAVRPTAPASGPLDRPRTCMLLSSKWPLAAKIARRPDLAQFHPSFAPSAARLTARRARPAIDRTDRLQKFALRCRLAPRLAAAFPSAVARLSFVAVVVLACPAGRSGRADHRAGRAGGRRCRHAQFRQRRHRRRGQGDRRDHRQELHRRPEGQGNDQHRVGAAGRPRAGVPDAALGAADAGLHRGRVRRRRPHRPRGRREAAGRGGPPRRHRRRRRRPDRHAGRPAALRIGGVAGQRPAPADLAEQHHRRAPRRQRADHHRLRRQPAPARPHHRDAGPAAGRRAGAGAGATRVGARPRADAQPAAGRSGRGRRAGRRRRPAAADRHRRRRALELHPRSRRQPGPRRPRPAADRAARHAGPRRRQHVHRLPQERRRRAGRADAARAADGGGHDDDRGRHRRCVRAGTVGHGRGGRVMASASPQATAPLPTSGYAGAGGRLLRRRRDDPGRHREQRADHHGAGARLQQPAHGDRQARRPARAGVRRGADRRGRRRQGGRVRHPVAGAVGHDVDADARRRRHQLRRRGRRQPTSSTARSTSARWGRASTSASSAAR